MNELPTIDNVTATRTGQQVSKYKIHDLLGGGGMAEVYLGYQENLDRYVAIKFLHPFLATHPDFVQRFQREGRALAALKHPHIVSIYDFDVHTDNSYYLVMEYIEGESLKSRLKKFTDSNLMMPIQDIIQIIVETARALSYAHGQGMIHRDIKPGNIMLDKNDEPILTDFGVVKMLSSKSALLHTETGALLGTPAYVSPEQAMGQKGDERSDIYSLGVVLFQMVTGQLPFNADTPMSMVIKHIQEPTPEPIFYNSGVPLWLQKIILTAMAKLPEGRYQTADSFADDLLSSYLQSLEKEETVTDTLTITTPPLFPELAKDELDETGEPQPFELSHEETLDETEPNGKLATYSYAHNDELLLEGREQKRPSSKARWLRRLLLVAAIGVALFAIFGGFGNNDNQGTVTQMPPDENSILVLPENTATATATAVIVSTATAPPPTAMATMIPTTTPTTIPTEIPPTATPTVTATPSCTPSVTLAEAYPYSNPEANLIRLGESFPITWVLENSGECAWPAGLNWSFVSGESFGFFRPFAIDEQDDLVQPGEQVTLGTNFFAAPETLGSFTGVWQLVDANGELFGELQSFTLETIRP